MQRLAKIELMPADAVADGYAEAQQPAAGGIQALDLNGSLVADGIGEADIARRVAITSTADDSGRTFTITGTDRYGRPLMEILAGPDTDTVETVNDFKSVTEITVDDDTAGDITAGTSQTVSSQWVPVDRISVQNVGIQVDLLGAGGVTYTVEQTNDDPFSAMVGVLPDGGVPTPILTPVPVNNMSAKNAQAYAAVNTGISALRLTLTAFAAGGGAVMKLAPAFAEQNAQ